MICPPAIASRASITEPRGVPEVSTHVSASPCPFFSSRVGHPAGKRRPDRADGMRYSSTFGARPALDQPPTGRQTGLGKWYDRKKTMLFNTWSPCSEMKCFGPSILSPGACKTWQWAHCCPMIPASRLCWAQHGMPTKSRPALAKSSGVQQPLSS